MQKLINYLVAIISLILFYSISSCNKNNEYPTITPVSQVHFVGAKIQSYQILTATQATYSITLGTTDVSTNDRTVTYKVTSPTNAIAGTHYTISTGATGGTLTIPGGKAIATIPVQGIFAPYNATGRKDTLIFTLTEPSLKSAAFSDTVKLALRGSCFEGDVTMNTFLGAYPNTTETFGTSAYGPYNTTVTASVLTSPTTGRITVANIWDNGWGPIQFNLDWTDPSNRTATVVAQNAITGSNAGDLNATYNGQTIAVRPFAAGNVGTFSACNNKITLKMQLGVTGVGFFGAVYTVNMSR